MKKLLGFVIITSFVCSYAMESEEVKTLSIVNQSPKTLILKIKLKKQKAFRRCLAPRDCKDFFVIKNLDEVLSLRLGTGKETGGFVISHLQGIIGYQRHTLIALKSVDKLPTIFHSQISFLEEPMSMEYPEFNCLCGYVTSRMMDTTRYFPGAYNCARTNYSIPGLDTQMNMDLIPADTLFNVPDISAREDVERAYAELCEMWNPERFDNPHQRTFAKRMMDILNEKYASWKNSISEYDCFLNSVLE
jgi:hypothetical protein